MTPRSGIPSLTLLVLTAVLFGCPPPPIAHLHNSTTEPIEYCPGWRCKTVPAGATVETRLADSFKIRTPREELRYAIAREIPIEFAGRERNSSCPNCPRYYLQFNSDARITVLPPNLELPATPASQPALFPLRPLSENPATYEPLEARNAQEVLVTVFRQSRNKGTNKSVFIDDTEVARLRNNRFFTIRLQPGVKSINAERLGNDAISIELEGGRHYFIRVYLDFPSLGEDVEEVRASEAESLLADFRRVSREFVYDERIIDE